MRDGKLHIDNGEAVNPATGRRFTGQLVDCTEGSNEAMCYGKNKGNNKKWRARFTRK